MSNKRRPLGQNRKREIIQKQNSTDDNYCQQELLSLVKKFKDFGIGSLKFNKPYRKKEEWVYEGEIIISEDISKDKKYIISGKSPEFKEAKRKLLGKLRNCLNKKKRECDKILKQEKIHVDINNETKSFLVSENDPVEKILNHTFYWEIFWIN